MLKRKGTMVYVDIISIESALNCLDNVIEYCESTCLTDKQIDELIAPAGEYRYYFSRIRTELFQ